MARQGITHLDRWWELPGAVLEHLGRALARVAAAAEERGHTVTVAQGDHAGCVQATAIVGRARITLGIDGSTWPAALAHQLQNLDRGVIVVQHVALRGSTTLNRDQAAAG